MREQQGDRVRLVICYVSHIWDQSCNLANSTCLSSVSRDSTTKAWALLTQMVFFGGPTSLAIVSTPHTLPPPNKLSGLFPQNLTFFCHIGLGKGQESSSFATSGHNQASSCLLHPAPPSPPLPSPPLPSQPSSL
jgi:hypothetical protein